MATPERWWSTADGKSRAGGEREANFWVGWGQMKLRQLEMGLSSSLFPAPLQEAGRGEQAQVQSMAGEAGGALLACCAPDQPPTFIAAGRHIAKGTFLTLLLTAAHLSLSCLAFEPSQMPSAALQSAASWGEKLITAARQAAKY